MSEWETFCDRAYYDLWRVRRKNKRGFNDGYHLHNGDEAHALVELLTDLERERDEWKAKFIQQNKDLGCEMMDPGGTIWEHASKLQTENAALQDQLDTALRLGKLQERKHHRELEQVREQYRLARTAEKLLKI